MAETMAVAGAKVIADIPAQFMEYTLRVTATAQVALFV
jgi:hypothetical protein